MDQNKIRQIVLQLLDMKKSKIEYLIAQKSYVKGLWGNLTRYGIEFTEMNHSLLVDLVQDILMDGADIEYEWSQQQYQAFVQWNPKLLSDDD